MNMMNKEKDYKAFEGKSQVVTQIKTKKKPEIVAKPTKTSKIIESIKKTEDGKRTVTVQTMTQGDRFSQSVVPQYCSTEKSSVIKIEVEETIKGKESVLAKAKRQVLKEHLASVAESSKKRCPTMKELNIQIPSSIQNLIEGESSPKVIPTTERSHEEFLRKMSRSPEHYSAVQYKSKTF